MKYSNDEDDAAWLRHLSRVGLPKEGRLMSDPIAQALRNREDAPEFADRNRNPEPAAKSWGPVREGHGCVDLWAPCSGAAPVRDRPDCPVAW